MPNEPITTEDEAPILDAIDRWLERDVGDMQRIIIARQLVARNPA